MRASHLAWFLMLLLPLVTHTLPKKKTFSHVDVVGNNVHKVSEETQQRGVKKTIDPDRDLVQEVLFKELVREQIRAKWKLPERWILT